MGTPKVRGRVVEIIARELGVCVGKIVNNASFEDDFGADAEARAHLIDVLEKEFGIEVEPHQTEQMMLTVWNCIDHVERSFADKQSKRDQELATV